MDHLPGWYYLTALIIPTFLMWFSLYFKSHLPKSINYWYGYRTTISMKNDDTWNEANRYSANLLYKLSIVVLNLEIVLLVLGRFLIHDIDGDSLMLLLLIFPIPCTIIVIPLTEFHMHKLFTKDGIRKSQTGV